MHSLFSNILLAAAFASPSILAEPCKNSPLDASWPSADDWIALNNSIGGTLIRSAPAASSCYPGNPFGSSFNCSAVQSHWSYASNHSAWPESIDYSIWNNNSCVPPGVSGYTEGKGCSIGGMSQYIVDARSEDHIATAMAWASDRNIRIAIKSTGHDLNGRSTGAYSLSIWTHNFSHVQYQQGWLIPGSNDTADVLICGGGNNWGTVYIAAHNVGKAVVGGEDATVGLGGLIQNGGHGHLSSSYGLASDNVYQVTVVTPDGRILVANDVQNQDLFWAIRGTGGGQFGVVTEFVLRTHPIPTNVVAGGLSFHPRSNLSESTNASWSAFAEVASSLPDLMDQGATGTVMMASEKTALSYFGLTEPLPGPSVTLNLIFYNSTVQKMNEALQGLVANLTRVSSSQVNMTLTSPKAQSYWSYTKPDFLASRSAGATSLTSSRLLGRKELCDPPRSDLIHYLHQISAAQVPESGTLLVWGLQGGKGPASTAEIRRGSVHPAWRTAYTHVMSYGGSVNATADPSKALAAGAEWYETVLEPVWRKWAPHTGSYMNEGNPFSSTWKHDFYGENYQQLLRVKQKYDPRESIFVWSGLGSDHWHYDLQSGLLCRDHRN
ncbi:hypothetical protein PDE_09212 [Penicillium oxalicum 114-2]|uniref:FAD-binding PCMH-type domain-containing protein n=1 Tax=Penicillium oxalicum (strain 114-2 / CGMCC 5302) TaxID=933388 RepID=S8B5W3_PENO1|nr:hypothetical protein PDE_09212 [Penicillium oxalicum 114-2]